MGEYFRMLRRGGAPAAAAGAGAAGNLNTADSKSQNSDYGSFCNTPNCDNVTTKNGATTAATTEPSGSGARSRSGGGTSPPRGGPAPDDDDKEEDNSMMVSGSAKTDVLTTRLRDSTFLLAISISILLCKLL